MCVCFAYLAILNTTETTGRYARPLWDSETSLEHQAFLRLHKLCLMMLKGIATHNLRTPTLYKDLAASWSVTILSSLNWKKAWKTPVVKLSWQRNYCKIAVNSSYDASWESYMMVTHTNALTAKPGVFFWPCAFWFCLFSTWQMRFLVFRDLILATGHEGKILTAFQL